MQRVRRNAAEYDGKAFAPRTIAAQPVIRCVLRHHLRSSPPDICAARYGERRNAFSFRENIVAPSVCERQVPIPATPLDDVCYMRATELSQFHDKSEAATGAWNAPIFSENSGLWAKSLSCGSQRRARGAASRLAGLRRPVSSIRRRGRALHPFHHDRR